MQKLWHSFSARITENPGLIRYVLLAFTGILLFAGFIHNPFPLVLLAIGGLTGTAAVIAYSIRRSSFFEAFGIKTLNRKVLLYLLPALVLGISLGILSRRRFDLPLLPAGFAGLAFVAPLIGAMEELVFRGYFQGQLRLIGSGFSILTASAFHTSYKLMVIFTLSMPLQFDFLFLFFWTFIGGLLFGILRELSKSAVPPMIAHAIFDILLYGGLASAPQWVWS